MIRVARLMRVSLALTALTVGSVQAQGAGATGAQVLQFSAGGRAGALSGAYTAATADVDALFYNPAGVATVRFGAALAYETFVEDIALASFAGAFSAGRFTIGLSGLFLDAGEIAEIVPDPEFGGQTGSATGKSLSATESIARLSLAMPMGERLRLGVSAGMLSNSIADHSMSTPTFDLGAQMDLGFGTVGAALRNAGAAIKGDQLADADLPTEGRVGAVLRFDRADGLGATLNGDVVMRLHEGSAGVIFGAEAGYHATAQRTLGAVARVGFSAADGEGSLGALKFGAGISLANIAIDYAFQNVDFFGGVHRFGVRWTALR